MSRPVLFWCRRTLSQRDELQEAAGVDNGCDRLLIPPQSSGSIRNSPLLCLHAVSTFGTPPDPWNTTVTYPLCLHAMPTSRKPSDPWITTVTSSLVVLAGQGKSSDVLDGGPELCSANQTDGRKQGHLFPIGKSSASTHTTCVALLTNAANRTLPLR